MALYLYKLSRSNFAFSLYMILTPSNHVYRRQQCIRGAAPGVFSVLWDPTRAASSCEAVVE